MYDATQSRIATARKWVATVYSGYNGTPTGSETTPCRDTAINIAIAICNSYAAKSDGAPNESTTV